MFIAKYFRLYIETYKVWMKNTHSFQDVFIQNHAFLFNGLQKHRQWLWHFPSAMQQPYFYYDLLSLALFIQIMLRISSVLLYVVKFVQRSLIHNDLFMHSTAVNVCIFSSVWWSTLILEWKLSLPTPLRFLLSFWPLPGLPNNLYSCFAACWY